MEFANRTVNGATEKIYAKDLIDTEESRFGYTCSYPGCGAEVALCSYFSSNLKAPYFKLRYKNLSHSPSCSSVREESQSDGDGTDTSRPEEYVSKLIFDDAGSPGTVRSGSVEETAIGRGQSRHNFTVRHIAPLIRWYVENPAEGRRKLEVPESPYSTYETIFQRLHLSIDRFYAGRHIYFGSLYIKRPLQKKDGEITLHIYQIQSTEQIEVVLDTSTWSESEIQMTSGWVDEALNESHEAYRNGERKMLPYIFFLGNAEAGGRSFRCNRHEAFYAMAVKGLNLRTKNFGAQKSEIVESSVSTTESPTPVRLKLLESAYSRPTESNSADSVAAEKNLADVASSNLQSFDYKSNPGGREGSSASGDRMLPARKSNKLASTNEEAPPKKSFRTHMLKLLQRVWG